MHWRTVLYQIKLPGRDEFSQDAADNIDGETLAATPPEGIVGGLDGPLFQRNYHATALIRVFNIPHNPIAHSAKEVMRRAARQYAQDFRA